MITRHKNIAALVNKEGWRPSYHGEFLDLYNTMSTGRVSGTILTRVDSSNHYFVVVEYTSFKPQYPVIAKIYPTDYPDNYKLRDPKHPVRYFDIRKLTESECLRLMDVPEDAITKLTNPETNLGLSRSSLYKLAGNSIVVSCLYHIFRNIWLTEEDPSEQMTLFPEPTFRLSLPDKIRMITLCSGYDSQALAMQQLCDEAKRQGHDIDFDLLNWSEFDPELPNVPLENQPAVRAHNVLFPQWADRNLGDMTKIDWVKVKENYKSLNINDIDLLFYSTPCQSISASGKREGMKKDSGTRSAILWYTENAIRALHPKILIQENVSAMVNQVNMPDFKQWQQVCRDCGYDNYWTIMNAKDYGVPQNRERCFMVSVRKDLNMPTYRFPKPFPRTKEIADVLDETTDEKYMLSPDAVIKFLQTNEQDRTAQIFYAVTDHKLTDEEIADIRNGKSIDTFIINDD